MDLREGSKFGRFEVIALLGEGGIARVFHVRDPALGTEHALKVVHHPDPAMRERIRREGEAQREVRHPNIVRVTETIVVDDEPALVMELVRGPTLKELLATDSPLPLPVVDAVAEGILAGVAAAHRAGRLHRDLKPANVLLVESSGGWLPKVGDFGLTKLTGASGGPGATESGVLMGTPGYMAPEQARDARSVDVRADVFSLGCVLYELATGERAFLGRERFEVLTRALQGRFVPPAYRRPDLPERHLRAIAGALQPRLEDRIPDCEALLAVWRGERDHVAATPRPYDPTTAASTYESPSRSAGTVTWPPPPRRSRSWAIGLLASGLLVALAATLAGLHRPRIPEPDLVYVPEGTFHMGSPSGEPGRRENETLHEVRLDAFCVAPTEVDQRTWRSIEEGVGSPGTAHPLDRTTTKDDKPCATYNFVSMFDPDHPVMCVSWHDAVAFANHASAYFGYSPAYRIDPDGTVHWDRRSPGFRLLTEAEWERAARADQPDWMYAGTSSRQDICRVGNVQDLRGRDILGWQRVEYDCNDGYAGLAPVGSLAPNGYGLHDFTGNVLEWTWDRFDLYPPGPVDNPIGPPSGHGRVVRGGAFNSAGRDARIAFRRARGPDFIGRAYGVRLARNPDPSLDEPCRPRHPEP